MNVCFRFHFSGLRRLIARVWRAPVRPLIHSKCRTLPNQTWARRMCCVRAWLRVAPFRFHHHRSLNCLWATVRQRRALQRPAGEFSWLNVCRVGELMPPGAVGRTKFIGTFLTRSCTWKTCGPTWPTNWCVYVKTEQWQSARQEHGEMWLVGFEKLRRYRVKLPNFIY